MYLYIHIYTYTYRHTDLQSNAHEDPAGHLNESVTEAEGSAKEEELDALRATLARERAEHQEDRQELLAVLSRQRQLRPFFVLQLSILSHDLPAYSPMEGLHLLLLLSASSLHHC